MLEAGVDMILIETMAAAHEAVAAAEVAEELAPGRWAISFCLSTDGSIGNCQDGTPLKDVIGKLGGASFIGLNCLPRRIINEQVKHLKTLLPADKRIAAYGNIGFEVRDSSYKDDIEGNSASESED